VSDINEFFLIRQAQKGNTDALESLITNYYPIIFAFIARRTGNHELAKDLTQDTFLRLVNGIGGYKPTGKFANYLFTIAVNVCHDYYRKNRILFEDVDMDSLPAENVSALRLEYLEDNLVLRDLIEKLPDMQKEVLLLRFFHDLKIKDIAKITNTSIPTVKSRLRQGLGKLRKMMDL